MKKTLFLALAALGLALPARALTPTPVTGYPEWRIAAVSTFRFTFNVVSVAANTTAEQTVPMLGCQPGDFIYVYRPAAFADGLFIAEADCLENNTLTLTIGNATAGALDPASATFTGLWLNRTVDRAGEANPVRTWRNTTTPTVTNTPVNTATNTPTSTPTNTPTNTPTITDTPTITSTSTPTITPTSTPTDTPTSTPTDTP